MPKPTLPNQDPALNARRVRSRRVASRGIAFAAIMVAGVTGDLVLSPDFLAAYGQEDGRFSGTIRSIRIEGNQRVEARTVQSYLLLQPGDAFDAERADLSLKTLFATNLFADVAIDRSGDDLIVRVSENPIINQVIFEGNRSLKDDKLKEEIQARARDVFTAARVQGDVQRILELYRQSGRFAAKVVPQYVPLEQNRTDLVFEITEGSVTGVKSVNFIGNKVYSDSRLRSEIVTQQSRIWRFFSSNDNYDPGRLEYDRERLRQFYQNNGYYDFRVTSAVAELTPDQKNFYITMTIEEGRQYEFGTVKVQSALSKLNPDSLGRAVPIAEGSLFRGDLIEKSIDSLTYAAGVAGYAFVDVRPQLDVNEETGRIDVIFAVDEGPRVYIGRLNIVGNTQTLDRVVRREIRLAEADAYNRVLLDRSRNRIRALGYFKDVEIVETPSATSDKVDLDIIVTEQPTGELSFSAGFSSSDSYLFDIRMSQRNLQGRGQSAVADLSLASRLKSLSLQFTEPRLFDRDLAGGIDVFASQTDYSDTEYGGYLSDSHGAGVRIGLPVSNSVQLGLRYRLQYDTVDVVDDGIVIDADSGERLSQSVTVNDGGTPDDTSDDTIGAAYLEPDDLPLPDGAIAIDACDIRYLARSSLCNSERAEFSSIVGYSVKLDHRNDPVLPTRGFDLSLSQDFSGLGGDVNYIKTELSAATYYGITRDIRATARLSGGLIEPFGSVENDNEDGQITPQGVRINNRFFRGGTSFRGFDTAGLGPRVVQKHLNSDGTYDLTRSYSLGGTAYYQGSLDIDFPNFLPEEYGIKSALFAEAGSVGILKDIDKDEPVYYTDSYGRPSVQYTADALSLRASAGLSVYWTSPFGPIRFDFAHILKSEEYDRTKTFRFSTSTSF